MTTPKLVMFLAFMWIVGFTVSAVMAGSWWGADQTSVMNSLTVIKVYNPFGLFSFPWINPDFFVLGVPHLVMWDMAFFGGEAQLIQYFFYVITIGFIFGLLPMVISVVSIVRG